MRKKINILFTFLLFCVFPLFSQQTIITQKGVEFSVRIKIVDENNNVIKKGVTIFVNGMSYSLPDIQGRYIITAKVGDDVRVTHPDFETVHHTLTSSEDIKIIVENYTSDR